MTIAVVILPQKQEKKLKSLAQAFIRGIESQGSHQVELINPVKDTGLSLTRFQYIVVGTESLSLFRGKIPEVVSERLKQSGMISGKRSCAFVVKSFGSGKALGNLMKAMEHEGMFINNSAIVSTPEEAEYLGSRLQIKRM